MIDNQQKIPGGWKENTLGNIVEKIIDYRGQSVPKAESGIPLITARNIRKGYLDFSEKEYIGKNSYDEWMTRGLPMKGDLLFTSEAPLGNVCHYPECGKYAIGQRTLAIRSKQTIIRSNYLFYYLLSDYGQYVIDFRSTGSTAKGIKSSEIKKINVKYPISISEQNRIVEVLEKWDKYLENLDQKIKIKKNIKKGLMQNLLTGKKRILGFNGKWIDITLGAIGKCYRGVSYKPNMDLFESDTDVSCRLLRSNNIQRTNILFRDMQYVNISKVSNCQILRTSDILICMANGSKDLVGKSARFSLIDDFKYTFGAFMGCFRINIKKTSVNFVFYQFQTETYRKHILSILSGSSINNLTSGNIENLKIKIPFDVDEQNAIANILMTADKEIETLEKQREIIKNQKKYLLNNLITGQIRLPEFVTKN